jgi:HAD superfamily hydrolase (TIGR01509 family)
MSSWPAIWPTHVPRPMIPSLPAGFGRPRSLRATVEHPPQSAETPHEVVVFDVMDTLLHDPYREAHEAATGLTFEAFESVRPEGAYHALERSEIDESAYWDALRNAGISVDVGRFHEIRRSGYEWLSGMRELLREIAARNQVILASNYPAGWIGEVRSRFFHGIQTEVCGSWELGVRKPSLEFFDRIVDRFGLEPTTCVLVDDSELNLDGAVAAGWQGVRHRDAPGTREALGALGIHAGNG